MKTKILFLSTILLLLLGCSNNVNLPTDDNGANKDILLEGTRWKLSGIFDVQNNSLKELNPVDCEECYTLTFETDSTATGKSSSNLVLVDLSGKRNLIGIATEMGETGDGYLFCDAVGLVTSCSCNENELKFFYNNGKNYLLYKPINDEEDNYTPINITLHDQPIDTILHYIQGKWQVVYGKGGFIANMIHHYDNYFMEFTSDGKYISNRDNYTYTATIRWDRVHSYYSVTDSSWLMVVKPYQSLLMDEIKNDTLMYHEHYVSEPIFYRCVKIK